MGKYGKEPESKEDEPVQLQVMLGVLKYAERTRRRLVDALQSEGGLLAVHTYVVEGKVPELEEIIRRAVYQVSLLEAVKRISSVTDLDEGEEINGTKI